MRVVNIRKKNKMNELARHIEFLLRRHDCVVIPGWGALLCNYEAAHFVDCGSSAAPAVMAPPARFVAFNELIKDNDGLLGASVARREGVGYEAAMATVGKWVDELRRELSVTGSALLGRIGRFVVNDAGHVCLEAAELPGINGPLPALRSLELYSLEAKEAAQRLEEEAKERLALERGEAVAAEAERKRGWRAYATGIVASLAVLVTVAMFLISPIRLDSNPQTASLVPTATQVRSEVALASDAVADIAAIEESVAAGEILSVGLPGADGCIKVKERPQAETSGVRFSLQDSFCVIVASFPSERQAETYVASKPGKRLGILAMDGKYRVYAATGSTRQQAESQKALAGEGAWVCRR